MVIVESSAYIKSFIFHVVTKSECKFSEWSYIRMKEISENIKIAMQLLNSGQFNQAEDLCHQVLHNIQNHPDALHMMGLIHHHRGNFHEAFNLISNAIENNPDVAVYYYNLGYILALSGEIDRAIEAYKESLSLKPDYAEAINNLGLILYDQDKIEESIILFQQAIRNKPGFTKAYYNLGNGFQAIGNPQAAIRAFNQVLKIIPDSAETRFNRSLSLLLTGNYEEGWVEYEYRFKTLHGQIKKNIAAFTAGMVTFLLENGCWSLMNRASETHCNLFATCRW
jgi:tetratricopeptide (TPR) repeat protein